jgi:HTH-type transcriptional regulator/antitoxin HigA
MRPLEDKTQEELRANRFACEFAIAKPELDKFIARVKPLYSKSRIEGFAKRINVHPGIVVGQLQFRKEIPYSHSREMLQKVRSIVIESALTDGYGNKPMLDEE